jgi:excinuclease UvrABC helicase subunit UvrB
MKKKNRTPFEKMSAITLFGLIAFIFIAATVVSDSKRENKEEDLQKQLDNAVEQEDYMKAAELRDKIALLKKKNKTT